MFMDGSFDRSAPSSGQPRGGAETHNSSVTNFTSLQITAGVENLTGINIRGIEGILAQWTDPLPTVSPFTWPSVDITTSQAVYGYYEDQIGLFLELTYTDTKDNLNEQIYDGTNVNKTAGFRPAAGWAKMGYIPVGSGTAGYRDYNNDGVRDQPGDVFNIGTGIFGENEATNRAPRYADQAIQRENCSP